MTITQCKCPGCGKEVPFDTTAPACFCMYCANSLSESVNEDEKFRVTVFLSGSFIHLGKKTFEIYVDKVFLGNYKKGDTVEFQATRGHHEIQITMKSWNEESYGNIGFNVSGPIDFKTVYNPISPDILLNRV